MNIYWTRKTKGRKCGSGPVVSMALEEEGIGGLVPSHLESGRPVLLNEDGSLSSVFMSVSDTKNYIFVCFCDSPVGIDAEERGRTVRPSSAKILHPLEAQYLSALEPGSSEWTEEFLRIWTGKESYMKVCGTGLSEGAGSFSVIGSDMYYCDFIGKTGRPRAALSYTGGPGGTCVSVCAEKSENFGNDLHFIQISVDFPPETTPLQEAAAFLDARAYSEHELKEKLGNKGFSEDEADLAVLRLRDLGYLDDYAYAQSAARKFFRSGKGKPNVVRELTAKGIAADVALKAADEVSAEFPDEKERAMQIALNTAGSTDLNGLTAPDSRIMGKIMRKLSSLGFEPSVIRRVIDEIRK